MLGGRSRLKGERRILCLAFLLVTFFSSPAPAHIPFSSLLSSLPTLSPAERLQRLQEAYRQVDHLPEKEERRLLFLLGYTHFSLQQYANSTTYFRQLYARGYPPLDDYVLYYLAESLLAQDRLSEASSWYQKLVTRFPASLLAQTAHLRLAEIAFHSQDWPQALRLYSRYLQRYPRDKHHGQVHYQRGLTYQKLGKMEKAVEEWRHIWIENPTDPMAEEARRAEEQLRKTASIPPPDPRRLYQRSNLLYKASRFQEALDGYRELWSRLTAPSWREKLLYRMAWCQYSLWQNEQAVKSFQQFRREFPHSRWATEAEYTLGKLYLRLEQPQAFLRLSKRLLQRHPQDTYTEKLLYLLGNFYEERQSYSEALRYFRRLLSRFPRSRFVDDTLWHIGWIHYLQSRYRQAMQTWKRLRKSHPRSRYLPDVLYWQGRAAARLRRWTEAARLWQQVRARYPLTFYAQQAERRLQALLPHLPEGTVVMQEKTSSPPPDYLWPGEKPAISSPRVQELWSLHLFREAARELEQSPPPRNRRIHYFQAAVAWYRAGEEGKAARLLRQHFWDLLISEDPALPPLFWQIAYPFPFGDRGQSLSLPPHLDPRLVAAIISAESLWEPDIRSPAGAIGLMQIMPRTGKRLAQELGIDFPSADVLYDPHINLSIGVYYLRQLLTRFHNRIVPAIASYNAGEWRVAKWWERWHGLEEDEFITNIPFWETRRYVQKVLAYYQIYQRLYPL